MSKISYTPEEVIELLTVYKLSDSGTFSIEEVKARYPNSFNDSKEVTSKWLNEKAYLTSKKGLKITLSA